MTAESKRGLSDFCPEWMRLYRIWEVSDLDEDWIELKQHQVECQKRRKPEEKQECSNHLKK